MIFKRIPSTLGYVAAYLKYFILFVPDSYVVYRFLLKIWQILAECKKGGNQDMTSIFIRSFGLSP